MLTLASTGPDTVPATFWVIWIALIALWVAVVGWNIWAIVDCARRPTHEWTAAGQDKTTWLLLLILVGLVLGFGCGITHILMPILYMAIPRPALKQVAGMPPPQGYGYGYGGPPPPV